MTINRKRQLLLFAAAALLCSPAFADTWLVGTVASYHFDRSADYNERNWGVGIEHDAPSGKARFVGGIYKNSFGRENRYAGISFAVYRLGPARFGMAFGLQHAGSPLPMFMPVAQIEGKTLGVNIVGRPRIGDDPAVVALQVKFRFN